MNRRLKEVEDFAQEARAKFLRKELDLDLLTSLYGQYAEIEDVELFVKRALNLFPNLNCGLASVYLKHKLNEGEVVRGSYGEFNHTFLMLSPRTVVDITADQYGGPEVFCGDLKYPWQIESN